jgi:hypothetical protein
MQEMRKQVMEHNIYRWAAMILGDLRDVRLESPESSDVYAGTSGDTVISIDPYRKMA